MISLICRFQKDDRNELIYKTNRYIGLENVVVVCSQSRIWLFTTPWTAANLAPESSTIFRSLLKFMSIESVMLSNHLILCRLLLLLPSIFPSIRVFSNDLALCTRWPKYWRFSFSISPSNWITLLSTWNTVNQLYLKREKNLKNKWPHRAPSTLLPCEDTMRRQPTVNREDSSFQNYKDACLQFITYGGLLEQPQWSRHIGTILVSFAFWKYSCSRSTFISGKRAECIRQSCGQVFSHLLF